MVKPDLVVTPWQKRQLKWLVQELSGDRWSEAKFIEGVKSILCRDDIEVAFEHGPTWAGVKIKVQD